MFFQVKVNFFHSIKFNLKNDAIHYRLLLILTLKWKKKMKPLNINMKNWKLVTQSPNKKEMLHFL